MLGTTSPLLWIRKALCPHTGQHGAQPLMKKLDTPSTARASLDGCNLPEGIGISVNAIKKARKLFGHVS